jgi:SPP1 gp7 family putative phage head morphogenesis protein
MAGELQRRSAEFRRDLLALERSAASDMVRAYGTSWQRIERRVTALWEEVTALRAAGQDVPPVRLMQLDRYLRLQDEITAELRRFAQYADGNIAATQMAAVDMAANHAPRLISAVASDAELGNLEQFIDFAHAPKSAIEALVGYARGNTPLGTLLDAIPGQVNGSVRDTLIAGLSLGQNPRETARQVRRAFGTGLARALNISRTETLRAYREATRLDYAANDDILEGWVWSAACDRRTCVTCWALHGRVYKLQRQMPAHPSCRCAMVPQLRKAYRGAYEPLAGPVLFGRADPTVQRAVLGPGAYAEYQAGRVQIENFVSFRRSRDWGVTVYKASLGTALERARAA